MNRIPPDLRYYYESRQAKPKPARPKPERKQAITKTAAPKAKDTLSPREREVFALYLEGHRAKVIAARLGTTEKTVWAHEANIMRKLGAKHDVDLIKIAIRLGYTSLEANAH